MSTSNPFYFSDVVIPEETPRHRHRRYRRENRQVNKCNQKRAQDMKDSYQLTRTQALIPPKAKYVRDVMTRQYAGRKKRFSRDTLHVTADVDEAISQAEGYYPTLEDLPKNYFSHRTNDLAAARECCWGETGEPLTANFLRWYKEVLAQGRAWVKYELSQRRGRARQGGFRGHVPLVTPFKRHPNLVNRLESGVWPKTGLSRRPSASQKVQEMMEWSEVLRELKHYTRDMRRNEKCRHVRLAPWQREMRTRDRRRKDADLRKVDRRLHHDAAHMSKGAVKTRPGKPTTNETLGLNEEHTNYLAAQDSLTTTKSTSKTRKSSSLSPGLVEDRNFSSSNARVKQDKARYSQFYGLMPFLHRNRPGRDEASRYRAQLSHAGPRSSLGVPRGKSPEPSYKRASAKNLARVFPSEFQQRWSPKGKGKGKAVRGKGETLFHRTRRKHRPYLVQGKIKNPTVPLKRRKQFRGDVQKHLVLADLVELLKAKYDDLFDEHVYHSARDENDDDDYRSPAIHSRSQSDSLFSVSCYSKQYSDENIDTEIDDWASFLAKQPPDLLHFFKENPDCLRGVFQHISNPSIATPAASGPRDNSWEEEGQRGRRRNGKNYDRGDTSPRFRPSPDEVVPQFRSYQDEVGSKFRPTLDEVGSKFRSYPYEVGPRSRSYLDEALSDTGRGDTGTRFRTYPDELLSVPGRRVRLVSTSTTVSSSVLSLASSSTVVRTRSHTSHEVFSSPSRTRRHEAKPAGLRSLPPARHPAQYDISTVAPSSNSRDKLVLGQLPSVKNPRSRVTTFPRQDYHLSAGCRNSFSSSAQWRGPREPYPSALSDTPTSGSQGSTSFETPEAVQWLERSQKLRTKKKRQPGKSHASALVKKRATRSLVSSNFEKSDVVLHPPKARLQRHSEISTNVEQLLSQTSAPSQNNSSRFSKFSSSNHESHPWSQSSTVPSSTLQTSADPTRFKPSHNAQAAGRKVLRAGDKHSRRSQSRRREANKANARVTGQHCSDNRIYSSDTDVQYGDRDGDRRNTANGRAVGQRTWCDDYRLHSSDTDVHYGDRTDNERDMSDTDYAFHKAPMFNPDDPFNLMRLRAALVEDNPNLRIPDVKANEHAKYRSHRVLPSKKGKNKPPFQIPLTENAELTRSLDSEGRSRVVDCRSGPELDSDSEAVSVVRLVNEAPSEPRVRTSRSERLFDRQGLAGLDPTRVAAAVTAESPETLEKNVKLLLESVCSNIKRLFVDIMSATPARLDDEKEGRNASMPGGLTSSRQPRSAREKDVGRRLETHPELEDEDTTSRQTRPAPCARQKFGRQTRRLVNHPELEEVDTTYTPRQPTRVHEKKGRQTRRLVTHPELEDEDTTSSQTQPTSAFKKVGRQTRRLVTNPELEEEGDTTQSDRYDNHSAQLDLEGEDTTYRQRQVTRVNEKKGRQTRRLVTHPELEEEGDTTQSDRYDNHSAQLDLEGEDTTYRQRQPTCAHEKKGRQTRRLVTHPELEDEDTTSSQTQPTSAFKKVGRQTRRLVTPPELEEEGDTTQSDRYDNHSERPEHRLSMSSCEKLDRQKKRLETYPRLEDGDTTQSDRYDNHSDRPEQRLSMSSREKLDRKNKRLERYPCLEDGDTTQSDRYDNHSERPDQRLSMSSREKLDRQNKRLERYPRLEDGDTTQSDCYDNHSERPEQMVSMSSREQLDRQNKRLERYPRLEDEDTTQSDRYDNHSEPMSSGENHDRQNEGLGTYPCLEGGDTTQSDWYDHHGELLSDSFTRGTSDTDLPSMSGPSSSPSTHVLPQSRGQCRTDPNTPKTRTAKKSTLTKVRRDQSPAQYNEKPLSSLDKDSGRGSTTCKQSSADVVDIINGALVASSQKETPKAKGQKKWSNPTKQKNLTNATHISGKKDQSETTSLAKKNSEKPTKTQTKKPHQKKTNTFEPPKPKKTGQPPNSKYAGQPRKPMQVRQPPDAKVSEQSQDSKIMGQASNSKSTGDSKKYIKQPLRSKKTLKLDESRKVSRVLTNTCIRPTSTAVTKPSSSSSFTSSSSEPTDSSSFWKKTLNSPSLPEKKSAFPLSKPRVTTFSQKRSAAVRTVAKSTKSPTKAFDAGSLKGSKSCTASTARQASQLHTTEGTKASLTSSADNIPKVPATSQRSRQLSVGSRFVRAKSTPSSLSEGARAGKSALQVQESKSSKSSQGSKSTRSKGYQSTPCRWTSSNKSLQSRLTNSQVSQTNRLSPDSSTPWISCASTYSALSKSHSESSLTELSSFTSVSKAIIKESVASHGVPSSRLVDTCLASQTVTRGSAPLTGRHSKNKKTSKQAGGKPRSCEPTKQWPPVRASSPDANAASDVSLRSVLRSVSEVYVTDLSSSKGKRQNHPTLKQRHQAKKSSLPHASRQQEASETEDKKALSPDVSGPSTQSSLTHPLIKAAALEKSRAGDGEGVGAYDFEVTPSELLLQAICHAVYDGLSKVFQGQRKVTTSVRSLLTAAVRVTSDPDLLATLLTLSSDPSTSPVPPPSALQ